jgi:Glycine zipper
MKRLALTAAAAVIAIGAGVIPASAACNGDTSTETALGAGSGALVGGLASHSIAGAVVGGVGGGLIGNAIGHSNNRDDCRRAAYHSRHDYYVDRDGHRHYYYR